MTKKSSTPAIRFKGFTDTWEQRKLGELADIVGGGTPSTGVSDFWDGDIDWYAPAEIAEQIYLTSSQRKITEEGYNHSSAKMLPVGTVLFTSRAGIGKTAILTRKGCTNQGFQSIVPHKGELDSYFIFSRTEELKQYGETVGAGSTFVEVSGKQMANMELMMPKTMAEQKIIGQYFANLDHLITLHQRKYDKLTNVKKSMLEKMFPKNGSNVPEIRFKGFTEAWEQRKVGEVSESYSGGTPSVGVKEYYGGQIPFIRSAEINSEITELFLTEEGLKNSSARLVAVGDILYALYGATSGEVGRARLKGAINQAILAIKPHTDYDSEYLAQWLRKSKHSIIETYLQGGQGNLSGTIVKELSVDFPSLKEQKAIGDFFRQLDNLITLHQRELEKLKNLKKACLEKMFV